MRSFLFLSIYLCFWSAHVMICWTQAEELFKSHSIWVFCYYNTIISVPTSLLERGWRLRLSNSKQRVTNLRLMTELRKYDNQSHWIVCRDVIVSFPSVIETSKDICIRYLHWIWSSLILYYEWEESTRYRFVVDHFCLFQLLIDVYCASEQF